MKKWLTSLFLFFLLFGSILVGMPFHPGNMNSRMKDCCDKAKSREQTLEADMARLFCAFNCSDSAPISSNISFNFSPSTIIISGSILKHVSLLFIKHRHGATTIIPVKRAPLPQKILPKYIQNHSFLI